MPSPAHLISKVGDPIFALFIGLSAAATRINREEKEREHSTQQTIDAGLRYPASQLLYLYKANVGLGELAFPEQPILSQRKIKLRGERRSTQYGRGCSCIWGWGMGRMLFPSLLAVMFAEVMCCLALTLLLALRGRLETSPTSHQF